MRAITTLTLTAAAFIAPILSVNLRAGQAEPPSPSANGTAAPSHGVALGSMDKTCKPCQDFYGYATGEWRKNNPIPPAYPNWSPAYELVERNRDHLHEILEKAAADHQAVPGSNEQKIGDFYASCMNEEQVNAEGVKPLEPEFERIASMASVADLQAEVARLQGMGVEAVFDFGSTQDAKNSTQVIGGADQGGLGLPDRDYYTKMDDKSKQIRQQYVEHVAKMFEILGDNKVKSAAEAKTVTALETKLAEASLTNVERRDPQKTYHKMSVQELSALTPAFSWTHYFEEIGHPSIDAVDVTAPKFFETVNAQLKAAPLDDWKTYLRWHLVDAEASALSDPFVNENFNFNGRVLEGTKELLPRWKRCVRATDNNLGEALGQVYVQQYFPPEAKTRALDMVNQLIAVLHDDLQTLPWMGEATRQQALVKLAAFTKKIGYPDKWRDYSTYEVNRGPYVLNVIRGSEFEFRRDLNKIGQPVDRGEWGMTPPTVNAYYNPLLNEIVFPAGILQPPFFDPKADDASNYGAMGAIIGHEMTHGFDDEGRQFDAHGNLRDWWTAEDEKNFNQRAQCVEKQFDNYVIAGDLHENGKLVLGESIADLGGLNIAYRALERSLEGKPRPLIDGFTPEQRFFLAYAQAWSENSRSEAERLQATTDPHPLARFRAIGPPSNLPAFAQAFDCKSGDAMVRPLDIRCQIW